MKDIADEVGVVKPDWQERGKHTLPLAGQAPKETPHSIELEQALLGAILISNVAYEKVSDILRPEHFHEELHGQIYETAGKLIAAGKRADAITIKTFFASAPPINENTTVAQYLGSLMVNAVTTLNAYDYAQQIFDLATRRALIDIGYQLVEESADTSTDEDPSKAIERAEQALYSVAATASTPVIMTIGEAVAGVVKQSMENYRLGGEQTTGIPTGITDLDRALGGGLQAGDLIIIAGRPSMGKTALCLNIGYNIAKRRRDAMSAGKKGKDLADEGGVVKFFSLEMSDAQLGGRVLATACRIPLPKIKSGSFNQFEAEHIIHAERYISEIPLYLDQTGGLPVGTLASRARRFKRKFGMDVLIIDYIQLMMGPSGAAKDGRTQEVTKITMGLKALAKELGVPLIALSQLSRDVEKRTDKRPQLSDLRESGSIEQDADVVMFTYRDEYYVERRKPSKEGTEEHSAWLSDLASCAGKADIIIGKQRQGAACTVPLAFNGELTEFSNLAREGSYQ